LSEDLVKLCTYGRDFQRASHLHRKYHYE